MDKNCKLCKLGCGKAVPGHGPKQPVLAVISDYPGRKEIELSENMVGKSGQMLRRALRNIVGLDPKRDVFYMNVIRCEVPEGAKITQDSVTACRRWTIEDLRSIQPHVVLIAGDLAFNSLFPQIIEQEKNKDNDFNISRAHGMVFTSLGKTYMATWNPAHVERNKFKRVVGGTDRRPIYEDWHPTGSVPQLFQKDMLKLRALLIDQFGFQPRNTAIQDNDLKVSTLPEGWG